VRNKHFKVTVQFTRAYFIGIRVVHGINITTETLNLDFRTKAPYNVSTPRYCIARI